MSCNLSFHVQWRASACYCSVQLHVYTGAQEGNDGEHSVVPVVDHAAPQRALLSVSLALQLLTGFAG